MRGISRIKRRIFLSLVLALAGPAGCGGGDSSSAPSFPPSNLFVSDGATHAVASLVNTNLSPGVVTVDRIIAGSNTGLGTPVGTPSWSTIPSIALDTVRDHLYVSTQTGVVVFHQAGLADGNIAPSRTFTSTVTKGSTPSGVNFFSLFDDAGNDRLYVAEPDGYLHVFNGASTLNGSVVPSRTILPDFGGVAVVGPFGIAVDTVRNMLYVGFYLNGATTIMVFNNADTINSTGLAPNRTLSFSYAPTAFYLDSMNDRLYVLLGNGQIQVFDGASTLATGAQTPDRTMSMPFAGQAIFVETASDRLYAVGGNQGYIVNGASTATDPVVALQVTVAGTGSLLSGVVVRP